MHTERRSNPILEGAGAMVFLASYGTFALEGLYQNFTVPEPGVSRDPYAEVSIWYVVPIVGPYLVNVAYNDRQQAYYNNFVHMQTNHGSFQCVNNNPDVLPNWCASMVTSQPAMAANRASTGDWLWATVLVTSQVYGLAMFIAGFMGHSVLVRDAAPARHARFGVSPGAGPTPVGLTLSVITM
jgi:hypothetical protein